MVVERDSALPSPSLHRAQSVVVFAVFAATLLVGVVEWGTFRPLAVLGAVVALAAATPLFLLKPRLPVVLGALGPLGGAGVVLVGNAQSGNFAWFSMLVLVSWCAFVGGARPGLVYGAASLAVVGAEWIWAQPGSGAWANWLAGTGAIVLAALLLRQQFVLVQALRAAQASLAERSAAEERNRIARELHDVIAHSLTVALLHVSSARLAVQTDPEEADQALAEAERLGRQSLDEVRATVGMLRDGRGEGLAPPVPTADGVPILVSQFRQAGAEVLLEVKGDLAVLPATTGSALYRIVQEALTNAAKHAPGAPVIVEIAVTNRRTDLRVESAGPARNGAGLGLTSMAERAAAVGGTCRSGAGGRGWLVDASLPVPRRAASTWA